MTFKKDAEKLMRGSDPLMKATVGYQSQIGRLT